MTTSASALPALAPNDEGRKVVERVNALIRWFNRPDLFVPSYAADTGSGTAYVIAPSADIRVYEVGQVYNFIAANANTSATPTLNVQGLGAGTITRANGTALSVGDISVGPVAVVCTATTPSFALLTPPPIFSVTTFATVDGALDNTANFRAGPSTGSIGGAGQTWRIQAGFQLKDTAAAASFVGRIHDGTNALIAQNVASGGANFSATLNLEIDVTLSGATVFTAQAKDVTAVTGLLQATADNTPGVSNKSTWIKAMRLA